MYVWCGCASYARKGKDVSDTPWRIDYSNQNDAECIGT